MNLSHALQPGASKLRGAGVGVSQTVLKIHQHLRILLVFLHLRCGHQNGSDPFGQVLHLGREWSVLEKPWIWIILSKNEMTEYKPRMCYTLSGTSPLAKLLMMARDCWNLEPPMPASAINWLTALITWVTKTTMRWGHIIHKIGCICTLFSYTDL